MRVLLINPYYPISETPSPPLGLSYLAGALEENGIEAKILDLVVFPYTKRLIEEVVNRFQPQVVGATCVTMNFYNAKQVLKDVKTICPDIVTVMGGPHVTFCAEETLCQFPDLDMIALGEGENIIVNIAKQAAGNRRWDLVPGIVYRDGTDAILTTKKPKPIPGEDILKPARHLVPLGRYRALGMPITLTTSRGCPFCCIFCVGGKLLGPRARFRRPEHVIEELEEIAGFNFPQVNIADDLFTGNKSHCHAICDGILERDLDLSWTAFARVDTVSHGLLEKMKMAGCHTISFGIESANRKILKTVKKGITPDQVISAVKICNDVGISPHASFILGLPGETPETLQETIRFGELLKEMGVAFGFHLLAPFPGTEVREKAQELGIKILTNDWSEYDANKPITETKWVTKAMLDQIVTEWESDFNKWLEDITEHIKKGTATYHEKKEYEKLEHAAIVYELMMSSALENLGSWKYVDGSRSYHELIQDLAKKINGNMGHSFLSLHRVLSDAFTNKDLIFHQQAGNVTCRWVDYL